MWLSMSMSMVVLVAGGCNLRRATDFRGRKKGHFRVRTGE